METKFNSLFDQQFDINSSDYYSVKKVDDTLLLNNLLLTFDEQKLENNVKLFERNFGDSKNYRLGPRPCSTRHASSDKFCDNPGIPEVYEGKINKCSNYFTPNSQIGDRSQYLKNIDLESRIRKVDYNDSKCNEKQRKPNLCDSEDENCVMNCNKNFFTNDSIEVKLNENTGSEALQQNKKEYCEYLKGNLENVNRNFKTFQPTKRKNVINW